MTRKALILLALFLLSLTATYAQPRSGQPVDKVFQAPTTCTANVSNPVSYNGKIYNCVSGTYTASDTGGVTDATATVSGKAKLGQLPTSTYAGLPTCAAGNDGQLVRLTDKNRDVYSCYGTSGTWASRNGGVYNVRDFGAKGDGSTSDVSAVNSAYTAATGASAATLYFPTGSYPINLVISNSFVTIRGAGKNQTTLRSYSSASSVIEIDSSSVATRDIIIEDLSVYGSGSGASNHGIYQHGALYLTASTLRNTYVSNCGGRGVYLDTAFTCLLDHVYVDQLSGAGNNIEITSGQTVTLIDCYVGTIATGKAGYRVQSANPTFIGCNGMNSGTTADIAVLGGTVGEDGAAQYTTGTFIGCNFEAMTRYGVRFKSGSWGVFRNCRFISPSSGSATAIQVDQANATLPIVLEACTLGTTGSGAWDNSEALHSDATTFLVIASGTLATYYNSTLSASRAVGTWKTDTFTTALGGAVSFNQLYVSGGTKLVGGHVGTFISTADTPFQMVGGSSPSTNTWEYRIRQAINGDLQAYNVGASKVGWYLDNAGYMAIGGYTGAQTHPFNVQGKMRVSGSSGTPTSNYFIFDGTATAARTKTFGDGTDIIVGVLTGTAAPAVTPNYVGQLFVDTNNKKLYVATGTTNSGDWTILN